MSQDEINNIKERLMAQAETRTFRAGQKFQRVRQVVPLQGMKAAMVMVVFDVESKRTAHAIAKRGFYIVNERYRCPGTMTQEDIESAYRMAGWVFYKQLGGRVPFGLEAQDVIQEAVSRLVEIAGDPKMREDSYKFCVLRRAMIEYLRRNQKHQHEDEEKIEALDQGGAPGTGPIGPPR